MSGATKVAVLHAACHPVTGPWSVMRELATAQHATGRYAGVGLAVVVDSTWPDYYRDELKGSPLAFYESHCPRMFGTATFLYQRLQPPPWESWIRDFATKTGADRVVVHLHNAWLSGVFLPLPDLDPLRIGTVATFHGVNEHFAGKPVRKAIHRWMAQRLVRYGAHLTSVDGMNTRVAEDVLGVPASSFTVIPNGIHPSSATSCPALAEPGRPLTVGHVGSMIPQKGWQLLAEAAERMNRGTVRVRVVLAGKGPDEAAARDWASRHAAWAEHLGFVTEPRERVMPKLDVLSLMSQWEGLPMSIIEAMSVGLPVVATDVGGVTEAVRDGETGLVIPRTVDALVQALDRLDRDRALLGAFHTRAREVFLAGFTLDEVAKRYEAVYEKALS